MTNEEKILKSLETINNRLEGLEEGQKRLADNQAHMTTAIEALATGQKALTTKQDVEATVEAAKAELNHILLYLLSPNIQG